MCLHVCDIRSEYQYSSQRNKTIKRAVGVEVVDQKEEEGVDNIEKSWCRQYRGGGGPYKIRGLGAICQLCMCITCSNSSDLNNHFDRTAPPFSWSFLESLSFCDDPNLNLRYL